MVFAMPRDWAEASTSKRSQPMAYGYTDLFYPWLAVTLRYHSTLMPTFADLIVSHVLI